MKALQAAWTGFRLALAELYPDANPKWVEALRCSFYAGADALMEILQRGLSQSDEITDDDKRLLNGLRAELARFKDGVEARKV